MTEEMQRRALYRGRWTYIVNCPRAPIGAPLEQWKAYIEWRTARLDWIDSEIEKLTKSIRKQRRVET